MNQIPDQIIRLNTKEGVRIFTCSSAQIAQIAHQYHHTSPIVTAAMGRALTAAAMMGIMQKGENDAISLQFKGDGPMGLLCAVSDAHARVRASVTNPEVYLPPNAKGKLDVGGAIGKGTLYVIQDLGLKDPYIGQTPLVNGEIAEDLTFYFAASEQTPTAVGLGVLVGTDESVLCSGGFIAQLMPGAAEEAISVLEQNIAKISSVTKLLEDGMTSMEMASLLTEGLESAGEAEAITPEYYCGCSRERAEKALISIGKEELNSILTEDHKAELACPYCDQKYQFDEADLRDFIQQASCMEKGQ